jgi:uncharacterized repeat protein (TIGR03803 family)
MAGLVGDAAGNLYGTTYDGGSSAYGNVFKVDSSGNETSLHSFSLADGAWPFADLVEDAAGNLYGTTFYGGRDGALGPGTVFRLTRDGYRWEFNLLYAFDWGDDGEYPWGGVTFGPDGALYGTTWEGGLYDQGTVFKLQPPPTRCTAALCYWEKTILYNFTGGGDGGEPQGELIFDRAGNLYGTNTIRGQDLGAGVVYELSPAQGSWNISVLYAFSGGSDGSFPIGGVLMDNAGNLYGTAEYGGTDNVGVVYELTHGASGWTENVLHSFTGGEDGRNPAAPVVDPSGKVFGVTSGDGAFGDGTAYELQPTDGGFSYSVIYQFDSASGPPPAIGGLTLDNAGNLYGSGGGSLNGGGTIFELSPPNGRWDLTVLWSFNQDEGAYPDNRPIFDAQGNLYGTTEYGGGENGYGTVWQLTP